MKAAYICNACLRALRATNAPPTARRLEQPNIRQLSTYQPRRFTFSSEAPLSQDARAVTHRYNSPDDRTAVPGGHDSWGPRPTRAVQEGPIEEAPPDAKPGTLRWAESRELDRRRLRQSEAAAQHRTWKRVRALPRSATFPRSSTSQFWNRHVKALQFGPKPTALSDSPWFSKASQLFDNKSKRQIMDTWKGLSVEERENIWPQVMVAALYQRPGTAYIVCAATLEPPPPGHAIADVLLLAAKHYQVPERRTRARTNELYDFVLQLLTKLPPGYIPFEQSIFGILVGMLTRDQAASLHGALEESQVVLHPDTSLQFAYKLVDGPVHSEHREKAFRIMQGLANDGVDLNGPRSASVVTALLHCEAPNEFSPKDGDDFSPTHALEALMQKGFIPNIITFTAYLDSLVQRGEAEEAVRLAKFYSDSGVALDAKAFVTVFRGAKQSMDPTLLRDVLQLAQKTNNLSVEILNNALHAIFCAAEDDACQDDLRPSEALRPFIPMLRIYAKMFDLRPLQSLIPDALPFMLMGQSNPEQEWRFEQTIVPVIDEFASSLGGRFAEPDSTTLATMFRAYIRSLSRPYDLMSLYSYFKSLLENQKMEGNYAAQLVREHGSLIHDTFMVAMLPQPGFTRPALEVFGDMLRARMSASTTTEGDKSAEAKPSGNVHPQPTIHTFGILLHGLLRMEQTELAEQIKRIMEEAGVEPNLAIWNILLRGYAKMQNVPQTVGTLRKLEASGFRPDKHTFKAFGLLRNQRAALEMMEEVIDINQRELDGQLSSERDAWR